MTFSFEGVDRRYKGLLDNSKKHRKIKAIAGLFMLFAMGLIFSSTVLFKGIPFITFPIAIALSFIPMGFVIFLLNYSNRYIMRSDDFRFFRIYDTYIKLQTYQDTKLEDDKTKAVTSAVNLSDMILSWTKDAPPEILELPSSVSKNLRSKLVPAIQLDKFDEISSFTNRLYNVLIALSTGDVRISHLQAMNEDLNSYSGTLIIKEIPKEPITSKIWKIKYILIIGGSIPVFVTSQILQEIQIGQIMEKVLLFSLALIGVVVTLYAVEKRVSGKPSEIKSKMTN